MQNQAGNIIDHYEIHDRIQQDRVMDIYQALDTQSSQERLVWIVFPGQKISPEFRQAFLEQVHLLSLLEHPNLLTILEFGEAEGSVYWVTPRVTLRTLAEVIHETRTEQAAAAITCQVAEAIAYIHTQNMVHGSLSPETVLIDENGRVLVDNVAMLSEINREISRALPEHTLGFGVGRPPYLAPEQIAGREATPQADIYALGALYYALLNGVPPFDAPTLPETAIRQASRPLEWPLHLRMRISNASIRLVHRCMARQEGERFKTAGDVQALLAKLAAGKRTRVAVRKPLMTGAPRRPNWIFRGILLAAILMLAGWVVYTHSTNLAALFPAPQQPTPTQAIAGVAVTQPPEKASPSQPSKVAPVSPENTPVASTPDPTPAVSTETDVLPAALPQPVLAGTQAPGVAEVITITNAAQVRESIRVGMGKYNQVAWGVDSSILALASSAGVFIINNTGIFQFLDPQDEASAVQFSKDGQTLAVGTQHGEIQLWDWKTGEKLGTLSGHSARISRLLFAPNGRQIISSSYDASIRVWSFPGGAPRDPIFAGGQIKDLALSTDGLLVVSGSSDGWVRVWSISSGAKEAEFYYGDKAEAVAISPNGEYIAAAGPSGEVKRWGVRTKQQYGESNFMRRRVWSLYYSADGSTITVYTEDGGFNQIPAYRATANIRERLSDVENPYLALYNTFGNDFEFLTHAELAPDGKSIAAITWKGDLKADTFAVPPLGPLFDEARRLAFSPDSQYLLAGGVLGKAIIIRGADSMLLGTVKGRMAQGTPFSSDSKMVALVNDAVITLPSRNTMDIEVVKLYNAADLSSIKTLSEFPTNGGISFTLDDKLVVAGNMTKTRFWDVRSGMETALREGQNLGCELSESANDGQKISVYSQAGLMTTWDNLAQRICRLTTNWGGARLTGISADHKWLAAYSSAGRRLEFYDMAAGDQAGQVRWWKTAGQEITTMAVAPGGDLLVTGAADGSLTIWNGQTGDILLSVPRAHFGIVRVVVISPDGRHIATSGTDGTVRYWEVRTGR